MSNRSAFLDAGMLAPGRPYAERADLEQHWPDAVAKALLSAIVRPARNLVRDPAASLGVIVTQAARHDAALRLATDGQLLALARHMRPRLRQDGFAAGLVGECFALVRECASRTLGMRHFDSQMMAGWALLQGRLTEMETGEGKTFAATLAASVVGLAGHHVHVVTVNDYLAERDADEMGPLYRFMGLSVGAVLNATPAAERRAAYARSIVYCNNKELAFDYLRDRVALGRKASRLQLALRQMQAVQRADELLLDGLHYAIVDEADSVFIDEARTPLILSATVDSRGEQATYERALAIARELVPEQDYLVDLAARTAALTVRGFERAGSLEDARSAEWQNVRGREELVAQAVTALTLFHRDVHYVVADGTVQIVDESTGRIMADRSWERGLHQLIEIKEGCAPTGRRETLARLTYQRLFRRYVRLAGMTGTGREVAGEIRSVYGLDVVRIPLHRPSRRQYWPATVCATRGEKWRAVLEAVERLALHQGRPVLIGTRSVGASEEVSAVLTAHGVDHALLNAKQDGEEAAVIAAAGQRSRVTVATNMAGRGTDIRIPPDVLALGGLHVILTEYHDSGRVDRQLFGRCARQGNPGSCQAIVSLEDDVFTSFAPGALRLVEQWRRSPSPVPSRAYDALRRLAQSSAERRGAALRVQNLKTDRRMDQTLAFSGRGE